MYMAFFSSAITTLKTLVVAIGAGLGVWGVVNLLEGYGNDNITSLSHISKEPGHQTADGWCRNHAAGNYPDSTAGNIVLLRGVVDEHHH